MPDMLATRPVVLSHDGNLCDEPRSQELWHPGVDNLTGRLATYGRAPMALQNAVPRRLAGAGFYYTGPANIVKCYSCNQYVDNFTRKDNPRSPRWHKPGCSEIDVNDNQPGGFHSDYLQGMFPLHRPTGRENHSEPHSIDEPQSSGHRQLDNQRNHNRSSPSPEVASTSSATLHRPSENTESVRRTAHATGPVSSSGRQGQRREENLTVRGSSGPNIYETFACLDPRYPHMREELNRARSFDPGWPARIRATPEDIARAGFFYTGTADRVRCWYCGNCLENWENNDDPWVEHAKWFPTCEHVLRHRGPDFVHNIVSQFPNLDRPNNTVPAAEPVVSHPAQQTHIAPPAPSNPPSAASSGPTGTMILPGGTTLHFPSGAAGTTHYSPNVSMVNTPGGMTVNIRTRRRNIQYTVGGTNPGSVVRITGGTIGSRRQPPQFVDPRQETERHERKVDEAMATSPLVDDLRAMGYENEIIRMVLLGKFQSGGEMYTSVDEMIDALCQYQQDLEQLNQTPGTSGQGSSGEGTSSSTGAGEQEQASNAPEAQLRRLEESRNCRICHQERATVVLMPCAHLAICASCSQRNVRLCPICKGIVTDKIRSFIS